MLRNGWSSITVRSRYRRDDQGRYFFVDRIKDVIRRRGENISSFALEAEITAHPAVREAVAVAVASDETEDDVLAIVTPVEGKTIDAAELVAFLAERVPHFMVPRYIRVTRDLPKTASGKLQKHALRHDGVTPDTFDRDAAGSRLKGRARTLPPAPKEEGASSRETAAFGTRMRCKAPVRFVAD